MHAFQGMASGQVHKRDRVGLGLGWLEQAVEAATGSWRASDSGLSSTAENVILLGLFGALSLVLWRRRNLRAAQQRAPNVRLSSCSVSPSPETEKVLLQSLRQCARVLEVQGPSHCLCVHMKVQGADHSVASLCPVWMSLCATGRWYGWWQQGRRGRGGPSKGRSRQQRLLHGNSQGKAGKALQVDQQMLGLASMARLRGRLPGRACRGRLKARGGKEIGQGSEVQGR